VVGIPDERFGQRVTEVVAPTTPGINVVDAIDDHLKDRLAGYKRPGSLSRSTQSNAPPTESPATRGLAKSCSAKSRARPRRLDETRLAVLRPASKVISQCYIEFAYVAECFGATAAT
jgi:hypothetical protein